MHQFARGAYRRSRFVALSIVVMSMLLAMSAALEARAAPVAGVQIHPLWEGVDDAGIARQLDQASASGAGMVRVDVGWASLEQDAKGEWQDWYLRRLDRVVQGANARGLRLLLTLTSTPCWASTAPETRRSGCSGRWWDRDVQNYAPADPRDYAAALGFLVGRYGDRVAGWEIWNEPNQRTFFKAPDPAAAYAALLKVAYAAAKAADPSAVVVGGSLADADFRFTERLYQLGVKGSFDAWSIHPYSGDRSPLDPAADGDAAVSFTRGVPLVRKVMLAHGDDKSLWLTELGWSTSSKRDGPSWSNGVDRRTQAANLSKSFTRIRSWPYVAVGVWYNLLDSSADPADRLGHYGLLDMRGAPKPAHEAFRRAAASLTSRGRFRAVGAPSTRRWHALVCPRATAPCR